MKFPSGYGDFRLHHFLSVYARLFMTYRHSRKGGEEYPLPKSAILITPKVTDGPVSLLLIAASLCAHTSARRRATCFGDTRRNVSTRPSRRKRRGPFFFASFGSDESLSGLLLLVFRRKALYVRGKMTLLSPTLKREGNEFSRRKHYREAVSVKSAPSLLVSYRRVVLSYA